MATERLKPVEKFFRLYLDGELPPGLTFDGEGDYVRVFVDVHSLLIQNVTADSFEWSVSIHDAEIRELHDLVFMGDVRSIDLLKSTVEDFHSEYKESEDDDDYEYYGDDENG